MNVEALRLPAVLSPRRTARENKDRKMTGTNQWRESEAVVVRHFFSFYWNSAILPFSILPPVNKQRNRLCDLVQTCSILPEVLLDSCFRRDVYIERHHRDAMNLRRWLSVTQEHIVLFISNDNLDECPRSPFAVGIESSVKYVTAAGEKKKNASSSSSSSFFLRRHCHRGIPPVWKLFAVTSRLCRINSKHFLFRAYVLVSVIQCDSWLLIRRAKRERKRERERKQTNRQDISPVFCSVKNTHTDITSWT